MPIAEARVKIAGIIQMKRIQFQKLAKAKYI